MAEIQVETHVLGNTGDGARLSVEIFGADGKRVAARQAEIPGEEDAVLALSLVVLNRGFGTSKTRCCTP